MKSFSKLFSPLLLLAAFSFLGMNSAHAQSLSSACGSLPVVGAECVGACGTSAQIDYQVGPLCPALVANLCVVTESSSLCPSHAAIAYVYIFGVLTASGDITAAGSTISFQAECGDKITVKVRTKDLNNQINCFWLGEVDFTLRSQF